MDLVEKQNCFNAKRLAVVACFLYSLANFFDSAGYGTQLNESPVARIGNGLG